MIDMTCIQQYYKAHPNACNPNAQGMCPDEFGYLDPPKNCNCLYWPSEFPVLMSCEECWNREIPEEKEKNEMNNCAAVPNFEAKCAELERENEKLRYENKELKRHLEKCELVVKCVEAFTGEKLNVW